MGAEAKWQDEVASAARTVFNSPLQWGSIDLASVAAGNAAFSDVYAVIDSSTEIIVTLPINAAAGFCPGEAAVASHSHQCE